MKPTFAVAPLGALLLLASSLTADTLVVGPGEAFPSISSAITAAESGDTLLVRAAEYGPIHLTTGKALTILGEDGVVITSFFGAGGRVEDLPAGQSIVVRNLTFERLGSLNEGILMTVEDCAGAVLFEDCTFQIDPDDADPAPLTAVHAIDSDSVTLVNCEIINDEVPSFLVGGTLPGLQAERSRLFLYETTAAGSHGKDDSGGIDDALDGGAGLLLVGDSEAYLQNSTLIGGRGGDGKFCQPAADGGHGVWMRADASGSPVLRHRASSFSGGVAGETCAPGAVDGVPIETEAGWVDTLSGAARSFSSSARVDEGQQVTLSFQGVAGDQLGLVFAADGLVPATPLGALPDRLVHVGAPFLVILLGTLPASGELQATGQTPFLTAPIDEVQVTAQALFLSTEGKLVVSGPSVTTILGD